MKTIGFKLSKRLNEGGYLDDIDTEYEYFYYNSEKEFDIQKRINHFSTRGFKTLTLEEAIEFLKGYSKILNIKIETNDYMNIWSVFGQETKIIREKTLLEAIELMLEHLLDNNLLTK